MTFDVLAIVAEIDHAIARAELRAQALGRQSSGDRQSREVALKMLNGSLYRMRSFRHALLSERQPGQRLN